MMNIHTFSFSYTEMLFFINYKYYILCPKYKAPTCVNTPMFVVSSEMSFCVNTFDIYQFIRHFCVIIITYYLNGANIAEQLLCVPVK